MHQKIWSTKLNNYIYQSDTSNYIECGRLNLFIGPNNSGKSRFARILITSDDNEIIIQDKDLLHRFNKAYPNISDILKDDVTVGGVKGKILQAFSRGDLLPISELNKLLLSVSSLVLQASERDTMFTGQNSEINYTIRRHVLSGKYEKSPSGLGISSDVKYYIPILRGMRPLDTDNDAYLKRTIKDYFPSSAAKTNIITGHNIYELLASHLLGKPEQREKIKKYEELLSSTFFNGEDVTLIPEYGKDTVAVKIGNAEQFPIYDLGDGLQQIIILTSAAYLNSEKSTFTIEEPENSLHPGYLRQLALFLLNQTSHTYFITTHSNNLIDLAELNDEISVFRFSKDHESNNFVIKNGIKDRELLFDLGVRASSLYLSNSTIWIEGITDRIYLSSFIKNYIKNADSTQKEILKKYIENYHYSFVEYQGGTLGHWCFSDDEGSNDGRLKALRTTSNILLLVDGDIINKGNRLAILEKEFGENLYVMPGKEIENILPKDILISTAVDIYNKKRIQNKDTNIKEILQKINYSTYSKSPYGIGYHLDKALGLTGRGKGSLRIFADESGTIKDKVNFALKASELMDNTDWDLTPEISSLCTRIFEHIKQVNE